MAKTLILMVFLTMLNYPAHAEKAMPEMRPEIGMDLIRNLSVKGSERLQLYCPSNPKEKCRINKLLKDLRVASGETSHKQASEWAQAFLTTLPKEDVKQRTRQEALPKDPDIANAWFVMYGDSMAFGQINKADLAKLSADQQKRAAALGALEMKLLGSLKAK